MKESSVIDSTVTFLCRHTYLVLRDTWKGELSGCRGLCLQQKELIIAVKGLNNECT